MDEVYEYNGEQYTFAELQDKYGDKVQDKIKEHGFTLVEKTDPEIFKTSPNTPSVVVAVNVLTIAPLTLDST